MKIRAMLTSTLAAAVLGVGLAASAEAKVFRYSTSGDILGLDPYTNNEGPTNTMKSSRMPRFTISSITTFM